MPKYEDFFVSDGAGKLLAYCDTLDEAKAILLDSGGHGQIYGAVYAANGNGLMQRQWVQIRL